MSSSSRKRPSSARRHVKYETFNQYVSGSRLAKIQSLLKGDNCNTDCPDCIVCIAGIDSRYNKGSQQLLNYLLFGFFTTRKDELDRSGFPEECIDDIIMVINSNSVDIYCNVINYHYLLPYTCHWYNVRYYCLTDEEAEVEDAEEDFKMMSFVSMVKTKQTIAIPYFPTGGHIGEFDKMVLEKWPLIQSFALDEIGGGGFFTMKYEVCDISCKVHEFYSQIDSVALEVLLTQNLPLLKRHWSNMETRINLEINSIGDSITENTAAEALCSYYKHGRIVSAKTSLSAGCKYPFVLFGCHGNGTEIAKCSSSLVENDKPLKSSGIDSTTPPLLMVVQAVSPNSPLVCSRTCFFTPLLQPGTDNGVTSHGQHSKLWYLTQLYNTTIEAVVKAIEVYSRTLSVSKATSQVLYIIEEKLREFGQSVLLEYFSNRSKIVFEIVGIDNSCRSYKVEEGVYSSLVKTATLSLYDVPCLQKPSKSHGSIMFSESFVHSNITVKDKSEQVSDYIILTSNIPRHNSWVVNNSDLAGCKELPTQLNSFTKYGKQLVRGETIHYTTGSPDHSQVFSCEGYIYENCIVLHHDHYGSLLLTHTDIQHIQLYDGSSNDTVWILILLLDKSVKDKLPGHLLNDPNQLILIFPPKSKIHKLLYTDVLPNWRSESSFPVVERLDSIPKHLITFHKGLEIEFEARPKSQISTLEKSASHIPNLKTFLPHLLASSVGCKDVLESDLPCLLNTVQSDDNKVVDPDQIIISIIGGMPGCHKHSLSSTLTHYNTEKYRWIVLRQSADDVKEFDGRKLHKQMSGTLAAHRKRRPGSRRLTKVLILVQHLSNIYDVVDAIESHPDPEVQSNLTIGAVTVCVDPLNFFLEHRLVLPGLLNDCLQGWVNNIVITSCSTTQSDILDEVQGILRSVNTKVALILAERGEVHRSSDIDNILSDNVFYSATMVQARYLSALSRSRQSASEGLYPKFERLIVNFTQPLDKARLINKLKGLSSYIKSEPWSGNIYHIHGQVTFTGLNELFEVEFVTLSQYMKISPIQKPPVDPLSPAKSQDGSISYFLVLTGCELQEKTIREWLRCCQQERLQKKSPLSRKDLSSDMINQIHKRNHLTALPSGWFYNGSQFISLDGEKSQTHPNLEQFIQDFIAETNNEITEYNQKVESIPFVDLFD